MPLSRVNLSGSNSSNTSITSPSANTILMKAGNINAMQIAWDPTASGNTYYKFSGASSAFASRPTGGTPEYDFANGRLRINNYTTFGRGPNNNDGVFFNVVPSLDGTVYYPQYTGGSGAGSLFIGMTSGGNGGLSIRTYRHGTSTSTYNENTMTQIALANDSGFTGIRFSPSNSLSSDANTLDDYEEGEWSPSWIMSAGTLTNSYATGKYVKIGRTVFVLGYLGHGTPSGVTSGATVMIGGLPFATTSSIGYGQGQAGQMHVSPNYGWINPPQHGIQISSGGATRTDGLFKQGASYSPNGTPLTYADFNTSTNYSQILVSGSYLTDA